MSADSGHSVAVTSAPEDLGQDFAAYLRMSKAELLGSTTEGTIRQTGGAYLGVMEPVPAVPATLSDIAEPRIETFVVDHSGACTPTGTDEELIAHVHGPAQAIAARTLAAMADFGVELEPTGYLSASVTPSSQVATTPHFDDDQYQPDAGVSLVVIAADLCGTRVANEPIAHLPARPNLPLEIDDSLIERFDDGLLAIHQAEADRILAFPQFGQLHAGSAVPADLLELNPVRTLFVLRFGTVPRSGPG